MSKEQVNKVKESLLKKYWKGKEAIYTAEMADTMSIADIRGREQGVIDCDVAIKEIAKELREENDYDYYSGRISDLCDIYFHVSYDNFIKAVKLLNIKVVK